jgi:intein-encoded DNA endonuclease-like protein
MKRTYLALGSRIELYYLVSELVELRLSYRQIQQAVLQQKHVWLSKSAISYWVRRIHNPLGKVNHFQSAPSPELAYVIGVVLGDGNLNIHGYNAELILAVTDYDFAEEFSASLATILDQPKPYKVRWHPRKNRWIVQGSSILLYNFLSRDWRNLKKWIEHCSRCRAAFLRAFYDAEGSVSGRNLSLYNSKKALLLYIEDLLKQHGIETSRCICDAVQAPLSGILIAARSILEGEMDSLSQ